LTDGHVASVDSWSQIAKQEDGLGNPKHVNFMVVVKVSAMDKLTWREACFAELQYNIVQ